MEKRKACIYKCISITYMYVNACVYAWIEKREAGWDRWSGQDRRVIDRTYDTGTRHYSEATNE